MEKVKTLGELKSSGYKSKSIKDELRDNLIAKIKKNDVVNVEIDIIAKYIDKLDKN